MAMLASCFVSEAKTKSLTKQDKAAAERRINHEKLMLKARKRLSTVPITPVQKEREAEKKQAERLRNHEKLAMHARRKPGHLSRSQALWKGTQEEKRLEQLTPKLETSLEAVIARLKKQIGKPYVWGGQSPSEGFDCSGLVYYAYNHVLNRKLPRTTNEMYQDQRLKPVRQNKLQSGDLIFFNINAHPGAYADHVGVYLGSGKFIEAPRTGLNVQISELNNDYWQKRYLGSRRILTHDAVL